MHTQPFGGRVIAVRDAGSGEMTLAQRLGPDLTKDLRQVDFGLLRTAVASTGGVEVKRLLR